MSFELPTVKGTANRRQGPCSRVRALPDNPPHLALPPCTQNGSGSEPTLQTQ